MSEKKEGREWIKEEGSSKSTCLVIPNQIWLFTTFEGEPGEGWGFSPEDFLNGVGRGIKGQKMVRGWFSEKVLQEVLEYIRELKSSKMC